VTRKISLLWIFLFLLAGAGRCLAQDAPGWEDYKARFVSEDGRVIDYYQNETSHSEGQGYGLLLAFLHDDPAAFDKIWTWTRNNLQVRENDRLLAWSWGKRHNGEWRVVDYNNATDGDLLVALALLKASRSWGSDEYAEEALAIVRDVRRHLAVEAAGRVFLLPGYYGFLKNGGVVLNPAYMVFPAYESFARVDDREFWEHAYADGLEILPHLLFTRLRLPADWVFWNASGPSVYRERSAFSGYEAIRVYLYLSWAGKTSLIPSPRSLLDFFGAKEYLPDRFHLDNDTASLNEASGGFHAVLSRVARDLGEASLADVLAEKARFKVESEEEEKDYYSMTLYLLAREEVRP